MNFHIRLHPDAQGKSVYGALHLHKARNIQWLYLFDNTTNSVFSVFSVVTGGNVHCSFLWHCLPPLLSWRKWLCDKNPVHTKQGRAARLRGSQRSDLATSEGHVSQIVKWGEKILTPILPRFVFFLFFGQLSSRDIKKCLGLGIKQEYQG